MRSETNSLTLGRAGFLGSGSAGLAVAVLNAASAACRESIGLRVLSPAIRAPLYQGTPIRKRSGAKRTQGQRAKSVESDPKRSYVIYSITSLGRNTKDAGISGPTNLAALERVQSPRKCARSPRWTAAG